MVHLSEHSADADIPGLDRQLPPASQEPDDNRYDGGGPTKGGGGDASSSGAGAGGGGGGGSGSSSEAEKHKVRGNECFAEGRWADAETHYTLALEACPAATPSDPPSRTTPAKDAPPPAVAVSNGSGGSGGGGTDRIRAICHANRAACYLSMERFEEAVADCTAAIAADAAYVKAYLRRGTARERAGDLEGALADNEKVADELEVGHAGAAAAVARLRPAVERKREEMKDEMMGKLKDLGNSILGNFGLSTDNFKAEKDDATGSYNIQFVQN